MILTKKRALILDRKRHFLKTFFCSENSKNDIILSDFEWKLSTRWSFWTENGIFWHVLVVMNYYGSIILRRPRVGDPIFMIPSNNISRLLLLREIRINEKNSEIKRNQEEKSGLIKIIRVYDSSLSRTHFRVKNLRFWENFE